MVAVMASNASVPLFAGLLGAAGLSSIVMLAWGVAAAIPIILHLLNRRRQTPIRWAAMQLLLQVIEKEAKRMRIEQLLLLVLRVLILITLAIAMARPFFNRDDAQTVGSAPRPPKHWIVALDTSYSMGYRNDGEPRFEAAKKRAAEMIAEGEQGDAYSLVAMSKPARAVIGTPTFNQASFLSELQRMRVQDTGSDLSSTLLFIEEIAQQSEREPQELPAATHVVFLSDFGRDAWQPAIDSSERSNLEKLQDEHLVEFESLAEGSVSNVAIKSVRPSTSRVIAGNSLSVEVLVESSGVSIEKLPVQLDMDGKTIASEYVDLAAGIPQSVRFEIAPTSTGVSVLSAQIPDDRLMADNKREHIIEVRTLYRILFVENERNDSRLLRLALRPTNLPSTSHGIDAISKLEIVTADLSKWDVIVMNDVSTVSKETLGKLQRFTEAGGSVVLMFGPNTLADTWNQVLGGEKSIAGFSLSTPTQESDWSLDPLDYRSPVIAPFAGFPDSGLLTTPIFRLWQIDNRSERLNVDLATTDGDPLIVRMQVGNGWVASVLSAPQDGLRQAGDPWNAIATWPSFLPLMQQLTQVVLDTGSARTNLLAGEVLQGEVSPSTDRVQITIERPDGSESKIATESLDDSGRLPWYYRQTEGRGVYRARTDDGSVQTFAVNVDPIESNLESINLAKLPLDGSPSTSRPLPVGSMPSIENDNSLARILLGLLFVMLVAESLLAWSMGRRIG